MDLRIGLRYPLLFFLYPTSFRAQTHSFTQKSPQLIRKHGENHLEMRFQVTPTPSFTNISHFENSAKPTSTCQT